MIGESEMRFTVSVDLLDFLHAVRGDDDQGTNGDEDNSDDEEDLKETDQRKVQIRQRIEISRLFFH